MSAGGGARSVGPIRIRGCRGHPICPRHPSTRVATKGEAAGPERHCTRQRQVAIPTADLVHAVWSVDPRPTARSVHPLRMHAGCCTNRVCAATATRKPAPARSHHSHQRRRGGLTRRPPQAVQRQKSRWPEPECFPDGHFRRRRDRKESRVCVDRQPSWSQPLRSSP